MTTASTSATGSSHRLRQARPQPEGPQSLLSYAKRIDPVVMYIWAVSTMVPVGFLGPLRYATAAYFAVCFLLFARQTMPVAARCWPLFLLPILCTISAIWSPSMDEALRKAATLTLTAFVAIYAGTRIPGRKILTAYFVAGMIAAVLSLGMNVVDQGAWTGIFGQKNFFAINMFLLYLTAFGVAFDKENSRGLRRVAMAAIPFAMFMVLMAKSGTTTLLMIGTTLVMIGHTFVWKPAAHIPKARLLIFALLSVILLFGTYIFIGILQLDLKEEILGALGKDSTLTGRTMLWEIAQRTMEEHPWTGLGVNGYWRADNAVANSLQKILSGSDGFNIYFTFHNSYLDNGVSYGYPGFWVTIFLATWTCASAILNWIRDQSVLNISFVVIALMMILRSTSEADLAGDFGGTLVLLFVTATRKPHLTQQKRLLDGMPFSKATEGRLGA